MLFAYKRNSSLGPSHDHSAYMAEIGCRSSTQTRNTIVCTNTGSEIQKEIPKWRESDHLCKITGQPSRQIVPTFAVRISGGFAYVEAPGDESGNLPWLQRVISIIFQFLAAKVGTIC